MPSSGERSTFKSSIAPCPETDLAAASHLTNLEASQLLAEGSRWSLLTFAGEFFNSGGWVASPLLVSLWVPLFLRNLEDVIRMSLGR